MKTYDHFIVEQREGVTILTTIPERVLLDSLAEEMGEELFHAADHYDPLILDWKALIYASSAYIGKIIHFEKLMRQKGSRWVMTNVRPDTSEVFEIIRVSHLFTFKPTIDEGIEFLRSS